MRPTSANLDPFLDLPSLPKRPAPYITTLLLVILLLLTLWLRQALESPAIQRAIQEKIMGPQQSAPDHGEKDSAERAH